MNFKTIHTAIKASIVGDGFKYYYPPEWFNVDIGVLPSATMQQGFAIRFTSQGDSGLGSMNEAKVVMDIEFALEGKADAYLSKIGTAQTAIRALKGVLTTAGIQTIDDEIWPNFTIQYLGEIVVLTFTIQFIITSN
jgi:hypothetical protein